MDAQGRDLIQRLAQRLNMHEREMLPCSEAPIIAEARAYLAQPKPVPPTDDELYELAEEFDGEPVESMRAALERWGQATVKLMLVTFPIDGDKEHYD